MDRCQKQIPTIVNKTQAEIDAHIETLRRNNVPKKDIDFFIACTELATWIPNALQEKDISINNLRSALFGDSASNKKKKKKKKKKNKKDSKHTAADQSEKAPESSDNTDPQPTATETENTNVVNLNDAPTKKSGHGRMSYDVYQNTVDISLSVGMYQAGDYCPELCGAKLYSSNPGIVIKVTGNPIATVTKYEIETLRCALCGITIKTDMPYGVSDGKYDYAFKAQLAVQKYFVGVPFYRQEACQAMLGFPLPDSTQFDLCEQVADAVYPVIGALENAAANAKLIHNDDTSAKILSVIADNKANPDKKRTGMFTTGILAKTALGHEIMLYYTGVKHAGENLAAILKQRIASEKKIIKMSDALSANVPKDLQKLIIDCNCLSHGVRKFRDLLDYFPEPCLVVIEALGLVYANEAVAKGMSDLERLQYHRQHSKPIMLKLHQFLKKQLNDKLVEPNSALGKAIKYMLKHWKKLRRFLTAPGAPLDNNTLEAALKIPIRTRKNAMFYKTEHGAAIANILLSLIETARRANVNPIEYLVALQENKSAVFKNPENWVPWKYLNTLEALKSNCDIAA